jgi:integrase
MANGSTPGNAGSSTITPWPGRRRLRKPVRVAGSLFKESVLTNPHPSDYNLCMVGKSRIKEQCPLCKGKIIERERQSKGEVIFDPRDYVRRDLNALKFENYVRTWLTWRAEEIEYDGISRGYLKSVESYLRNHSVPFFEGLNIREIQEGHIDDFRRHLPRHLRSKTVKNILGILGKIFQDAYGRRDIERIPIIPRVKRETPPIRSIEEEDQERILARADDPVYRVFFLFLMKQGCRPNEGRAHKWDRVDFRRNQVIINAAVDEGWVSTSAYTKGPNIRGLPSH